MENDELGSVLEGTSESSRLKLIEDLYNELAERQFDFCDSFCIHCDSGCGSCCEHFNPDVTNLEAEYLAYCLIVNGKDEYALERLASWENPNYCPFYRKDSEYHCTIYTGRPLVCRLFGSSASTDKNGHLRFRKCKWSSLMKDLTPEELEPKKDHVVNMADFGVQLEEDEPGEGQTYPVCEAIPRAIQKLRFLISLKLQQED